MSYSKLPASFLTVKVSSIVLKDNIKSVFLSGRDSCLKGVNVTCFPAAPPQRASFCHDLILCDAKVSGKILNYDGFRKLLPVPILTSS